RNCRRERARPKTAKGPPVDGSAILGFIGGPLLSLVPEEIALNDFMNERSDTVLVLLRAVQHSFEPGPIGEPDRRPVCIDRELLQQVSRQLLLVLQKALLKSAHILETAPIRQRSTRVDFRPAREPEVLPVVSHPAINGAVSERAIVHSPASHDI